MKRVVTLTCLVLFAVGVLAGSALAQTRGADFLPRDPHSLTVRWLDGNRVPMIDPDCQEITAPFHTVGSTPDGLEYRMGYPDCPCPASPGAGPCFYVDLVTPQDQFTDDPFADVVFQFTAEVSSIVNDPQVTSTPEVLFDPPFVDGLTYTYSHAAPFEPCTAYRVSITADVVLTTPPEPREPFETASCSGHFFFETIPGTMSAVEGAHYLRAETGALLETWFDHEGGPRENLLLPADVSVGSSWVVNPKGTTGSILDVVTLSNSIGITKDVLLVEYDVADSSGVGCGVRDPSRLWSGNTRVRLWFAAGLGVLVGEFYDCDGLTTMAFEPIDLVTAVRESPHRPDAILIEALPNPFNPRTLVRFALPSAGPVTLRIYDAAGRRIRTLLDAPRPAGWSEVAWDGHDDSGTPVASGAYVVQVRAGGRAETRRLVLLK